MREYQGHSCQRDREHRDRHDNQDRDSQRLCFVLLFSLDQLHLNCVFDFVHFVYYIHCDHVYFHSEFHLVWNKLFSVDVLRPIDIFEHVSNQHSDSIN